EAQVPGPHGHGEAGRHRLLAERQMAGALDQVLQKQVVGALLGLADLELDAIKPQPRFLADIVVQPWAWPGARPVFDRCHKSPRTLDRADLSPSAECGATGRSGKRRRVGRGATFHVRTKHDVARRNPPTACQNGGFRRDPPSNNRRPRGASTHPTECTSLTRPTGRPCARSTTVAGPTSARGRACKGPSTPLRRRRPASSGWAGPRTPGSRG